MSNWSLSADKCCWIAIMIVNVTDDPALTTLYQGVTAVHAVGRLTVGLLPTVVGIGHQVHHDLGKSVGFDEVENDDANECVANQHQTGEDKQDVTHVEQDVAKSFYKGV